MRWDSKPCYESLAGSIGAEFVAGGDNMYQRPMKANKTNNVSIISAG